MSKIRILAFFSAAALCAATASAQSELYDRVAVDFSQSVNVNGTTLPPGHYEIHELRNSGGGVRILFVASDHGTRFEASGATIPILSNETPGETKVILQRVGQNYYLNKIWIDGKNYGYEFPLPAEAKNLMQEKMEPLTLTATYRAGQPAQVAQTPPPSPPAPAPQEPAPQPAPQPAPAPERNPEPQTAPPPETRSPAEANEPAPPQPPAPEPRQDSQSAPNMPATADNWVTLVMVGGGIAGLGTLLRKR